MGVEGRTPGGIGTKLRTLKALHPELQGEAGVWIWNQVDAYIRDCNIANLDELLYFSPTELEAVSQYEHPKTLTVLIRNLTTSSVQDI
ncbi:hypothetical protein EPUS_09305 [Endocarpon pusillum Z07020]|uniref:Uncharacterized protein n=1 Tax=Endocarpon pusillum (strain Z07020 / HMAS-L-300199) TaxID=1263415 RepID=U1GSY1_ENDPU|nr:uncharacterized protein EPUS_09305 [Endocarpon pusillum Z07020]ERF75518.1 hypothetical protein EPUS_09305 [Endocarpon pusillum Z07020]